MKIYFSYIYKMYLGIIACVCLFYLTMVWFFFFAIITEAKWIIYSLWMYNKIPTVILLLKTRVYITVRLESKTKRFWSNNSRWFFSWIPSHFFTKNFCFWVWQTRFEINLHPKLSLCRSHCFSIRIEIL